MPNSDDQVERIVHEVLARLSGRAAGRTAAAKTENGPKDTAPAAANGEFIITDSVVSAATLADRLAGVQRVIVPPRAVITPSARDVLREKNVTLVRALKPTAPATVRLALATAGVKFDATDVVRSLRQLGIEVEQLAAVGLAQVIGELADEVSKGGKLGVLLTDHVAVTLCLANRRRGVRAATAANRGEVNDVIGNIGANLLVIDASRRSKLEVQRCVEAFATAGPRQCPAEWNTALE